MNEHDPIREADLHAYVDGQLDEARRVAVEHWLAANPADAERVRVYRQHNAGLHALFNSVLDEALPAALQTKPARRAGLPRSYAALFATAFVSGIVGWGLHGLQTPRIALDIPQQAALAHLVYAPEVLHPVEVAANDEAHLVNWLSKRLGAPVRAPHLQDAGFELIGGRLLPSETGPAAQFMYQDTHGSRLTLYVSDKQVDNHETAFRYAREGKVGVFYWVDGPFGYALSGEFERAQLQRVAETVYRALNP